MFTGKLLVSSMFSGDWSDVFTVPWVSLMLCRAGQEGFWDFNGEWAPARGERINSRPHTIIRAGSSLGGPEPRGRGCWGKGGSRLVRESRLAGYPLLMHMSTCEECSMMMGRWWVSPSQGCNPAAHILAWKNSLLRNGWLETWNGFLRDISELLSRAAHSWVKRPMVSFSVGLRPLERPWFVRGLSLPSLPPNFPCIFFGCVRLCMGSMLSMKKILGWKMWGPYPQGFHKGKQRRHSWFIPEIGIC